MPLASEPQQYLYLRQYPNLLTNRYYDPSTGKFASRDPIGTQGGENLYGYAGGDPVNEADPSGESTVELRFTRLGGVGNLAWYHAYVIVIGNSGKVYYVRGGPARTPGIGAVASATGGTVSQSSGRFPAGASGSSRGSSSGSSDSANSSSPGSSRGGRGKDDGPLGQVVMNYGPYVRHTPDYTTKPVPTLVVVPADKHPAAYYMTMFDREAAKIERAGVVYNPFTTNSNAVAHDLLSASGLRAPEKLPVWAPGYDTRLPLWK